MFSNLQLLPSPSDLLDDGLLTAGIVPAVTHALQVWNGMWNVECRWYLISHTFHTCTSQHLTVSDVVIIPASITVMCQVHGGWGE